MTIVELSHSEINRHVAFKVEESFSKHYHNITAKCYVFAV